MTHPGGRPPLYTTVEELKKIVDEYFEWCDNASKKVVDKDGTEYQISHPAPYTMSGLARRLGMSRETLVQYGKKDGFSDTIKEARAKVEEDVETRMNDKERFTAGLIFNAKNNFGWKDRTETDLTTGGKPIPILSDVHQDNSNREAPSSKEEN